MRYYVPLLGGIGNLCLVIPLMLHLKDLGHEVVATRRSIDFKQCEALLAHAYDDIVANDEKKLLAEKNAVGPLLNNKYNPRITPEWKGWFTAYKIPMPAIPKYYTMYTEASEKFDVGICPTCKDNWHMKKYPHWPALVNKIADTGRSVGVFGLAKDGHGINYAHPNVTDMRGNSHLLLTAGRLKNCGIVMANEGGLAHLATAQGTMTYILQGGSDHNKGGHPTDNHKFISVGLNCQPCQHRPGRVILREKGLYTYYGCPKAVVTKHGSVNCLRKLTPNMVFKGIFK
jgi:ADP-heptose:LPS heptosyltransferase